MSDVLLGATVTAGADQGTDASVDPSIVPLNPSYVNDGDGSTYSERLAFVGGVGGQDRTYRGHWVADLGVPTAITGVMDIHNDRGGGAPDSVWYSTTGLNGSWVDANAVVTDNGHGSDIVADAGTWRYIRLTNTSSGHGLFYVTAVSIERWSIYGSAGCGAAFIATPTSGVAPLDVTFTDLSAGSPIAWLWDFGDGDTSTDQNPVHTYLTGGSYSVSLTITNADVCSDTVVRVAYVTVLPGIECGQLIFDVYSVTTGGIAYLETLCSAKAKRVTIELDGTGRGEFTINRYSSEATAAVLGTGGLPLTRLVQVRLAALSTSPIFAFWIETGDFTLLTAPAEEGGENLHFSGRGALAYTDRGIMADRSFITEPFEGVDPVDGVWTFERPDLSSALALLKSNHNGTGSLLTAWPLPSISPTGDDVLLVAFIQVRAAEDVTLPAGWTIRAQQDTSGFTDELRYLVADKLVSTGAPPYADTATSVVPVRWTAAQLGFRATGTPSPATAAAFDGFTATTSHTITATLDAAPVAGSILIAYLTETTTGSGTLSYVLPPGWAILERIPPGNHYTGNAAVAYKVADGTETAIAMTVKIAGTLIDSTTLLVAEYPILFEPLAAGEVLWWVLQELREAGRVIGTAPSQPVLQLQLTFDDETDSNGDPWETNDSTRAFTAQVGERVLSVEGRLLGSGQLVIQCSPQLVVSAYNRSTYGRDLTGGAFGAGVVRWQRGVNVTEVLVRDVQGRIQATHDLVGGTDNVYGHAVAPDASSRPHWEQYLTADSSDAAALDGVGAADLAQRTAHAETTSFPVLVGNDEAAGKYTPGPADLGGHYWVGDFITNHTGTSDFDLDEVVAQIASITIASRAAETQLADLAVTVELGAAYADPSQADSGSGDYGGGLTSSTGGGGTSTHNHPQYQPKADKGQPSGYAGLDTDALVPVGQLGSGADGSGDNALWDDGTWRPVAASSSDGTVPTYVGPGETFAVAVNRQALFSVPITVAAGGTLAITGYLVEVH